MEDINDYLVGTLEHRAYERGRARGFTRGCRDGLLLLLEDRFGSIPEELRRRIDAIDDDGCLARCVRQTAHIQTLDKLQF